MSPKQGLLAFALAAIAAVLLVRGCDDAPTPGPVRAQAAPASPDDTARAAARARAQAEAEAEAELRQRHDAAMRAAVSTLHRYLAKLPEDRAAADAFWSGNAPPEGASEADLRQLPAPPSHFRTRNRSPQVLEGAPVPTAIRIPVELRMSPQDGPTRRYTGWYELRHDPAQDAWLLTGASVDVQDAQQ